jgi:hypothetical protein
VAALLSPQVAVLLLPQVADLLLPQVAVLLSPQVAVPCGSWSLEQLWLRQRGPDSC